MELEACWEAWRRAEGCHSMREPTVRISVELDDVTVDLRPSEMAIVQRLERSYRELANIQEVIIFYGDLYNIHQLPVAVGIVQCLFQGFKCLGG